MSDGGGFPGFLTSQIAPPAGEADLFRALADELPQLIFTCNRDGRMDWFSRRWFEYTGFGSVADSDRHWAEAVLPADRQEVLTAWARALQTGEPYDVWLRLRHRDGYYRWMLCRAAPQRRQDGVIERWFGFCTDIEDLAGAAPALRTPEPDRPVLLVVDDEPLVRMTAADLLGDVGFQVVEAGRADEALAQAISIGDALSAALIDLKLPDGGGERLISSMRHHHPDLPVVVMTGYDTTVIKERVGGVAGVAVLMKPFDTERLLDALAQLGVKSPAASPAAA
jgi:PAS domain S-box-containing protein